MNFFLLQAAAQGGDASFLGKYGMYVMMGLIIVIFWLFIIRPQSKRQKELQKKRDAMEKGDKVVTAGGIHGTIKSVGDSYFVITIAHDTDITIEKSSVFAVYDKDSMESR